MGLHFKWCKFLKNKTNDYRECECEKHRYWIILGIALAILLLEIAGGIISGSLALFADAVHVAVDFSNVILSIIVVYLIKNFGFEEKKTRDYGAILGMSTLTLGVFLIAKEAVERLINPIPTTEWIMLIIASIGAFANYFMEFMLRNVPEEEKHVTNKIFHLHVQLDLYLSYAVIISSILIMITGWHIFDPIASIVICFYVVSNIWNWATEEKTDEKCNHNH